MAQHVELSVSDPYVAYASLPLEDPVEPEYLPYVFDPHDSLERWASVVRGAAEPCLVIDAAALIVAASEPCCQLLGLGSSDVAANRHLLDGTLRFVDFTATHSELSESEITKIAPLLALSSRRLARGLIRVRCGFDSQQVCTADAIATPLWQGQTVVGSLTFFSPV